MSSWGASQGRAATSSVDGQLEREDSETRWNPSPGQTGMAGQLPDNRWAAEAEAPRPQTAHARWQEEAWRGMCMRERLRTLIELHEQQQHMLAQLSHEFNHTSPRRGREARMEDVCGARRALARAAVPAVGQLPPAAPIGAMGPPLGSAAAPPPLTQTRWAPAPGPMCMDVDMDVC